MSEKGGGMPSRCGAAEGEKSIISIADRGLTSLGALNSDTGPSDVADVYVGDATGPASLQHRNSDLTHFCQDPPFSLTVAFVCKGHTPFGQEADGALSEESKVCDSRPHSLPEMI